MIKRDMENNWVEQLKDEKIKLILKSILRIHYGQELWK